MNFKEELARGQAALTKLAFGEQPPTQLYNMGHGLTVQGAVRPPPVSVAPRRSRVILNALTGASVGSALGSSLAPAFEVDPNKAMLVGMAGGALLGATAGPPQGVRHG